MKKFRTIEEIERSQYISVPEIMRLFGHGRPTARRLFKAAEALDIADLGDNRVITHQVRLKSLYRVMGIKKAVNA